MSISPVVRRARSFEELLAIPGGDGPYLFTSIFQERGWRERRRSRRKFRLLKRTDGRIRETTRMGEQVLFLTAGGGFSFWEQWVVGWRRAIVVTNRRVVFLQLDSWRRPTEVRCQLDCGAIAGVELLRRGRIRIDLRSGESLLLRGVPRDDREALCDRLVEASRVEEFGLAAESLENLCPHCHRGFEGRPDACPHCLKPFWRAWQVAVLSLLVPGWGSMLLGHRGFALLELLAAASLWLAYLVGLEAWGVSGLRAAVEPEWAFLAIHGGDALWSWYVALQGVRGRSRRPLGR